MATNQVLRLAPTILMGVLLLMPSLLGAVESRVDERERTRRLEKLSEQFFADLFARKFADATALLSEPLQQSLGPKGLQQLIEKTEARFQLKMLREHPYVRDTRIGDVALFEGHLSFGHTPQVPNRWSFDQIPLRLSFDQKEQIDGLWLDGTSPEAPAAFRGENIGLGSLAELAQRAAHVLVVHVLDSDGAPADGSHAGVWRAVKLADVPVGFHYRLWHETSKDTYWQGVDGGAGPTFNAINLLPGVYRVTASGEKNVPARRGKGEPFEIVAGRATEEVVVRLQPGATVLVTPVDTATGETPPRPKVALHSLEGSWPQPFYPSSSDALPLRIAGVPPGRYRIVAGLESNAPDGFKYEMQNPEQTIDVAGNNEQAVDVPLVARPLTEEEIERRWGWTAFGRVTNEAGEPVAGADVRVATGMGTLMGGGSTKTNRYGEYRLRFGEGTRSTQKANPQLAVFFVSQPGYLVKSTSRPRRTAMARELTEDDGYFGHPNDQVALMGQPYRLDFVLAKAAELSATLVDGDGQPIAGKLELVGPSSHDGYEHAGPANPDDAATRWNVLPQMTFHFATTPTSESGAIRSQSFTLPEASAYAATLRLTQDAETGLPLLTIDRFTSADDAAAPPPVLGDDPLARPPVSAELQRRGREILAQMAERNRLWLSAEPQLVNNFGYTLRFDNGESQQLQVSPEKRVSSSVRHGISYGSTLHHLVARPDEVIFRQVDVVDDVITLCYAWSTQVGTYVGNGAERTWAGFRSAPARDGTLILDAKRLLPLENQAHGFNETYSQYHELGNGQFVPLAIAVNSGEHRYRWTFQVFEPGLWLFANSYKANDDQAPRIVSLRQVDIDGVRMEPTHVGRAEWNPPAE